MAEAASHGPAVGAFLMDCARSAIRFWSMALRAICWRASVSKAVNIFCSHFSMFFTFFIAGIISFNRRYWPLMLVRRLPSEPFCLSRRRLLTAGSLISPPLSTPDKVFESVRVIGSAAMSAPMLVVVGGAMLVFVVVVVVLFVTVQVVVVVVVVAIFVVYVRDSGNGCFKQLNVCMSVANWKFVRHQTS